MPVWRNERGALSADTETERFFRVLPQRLVKFSLRLAPDKTRIIRFNRFRSTNGKRFCFLSLSFIGEPVARVKPSCMRLRLAKSCKAAWANLPIGVGVIGTLATERYFHWSMPSRVDTTIILVFGVIIGA